MPNNLPIGVFDSGVGGLTVLDSLQKRLPQESFIYFGDTARLPYGTKGEHVVTQYALQASRILMNRGIKALVVACNTATSLALHALKKQITTIPVLGVLEPGARVAVQTSTTKRIAVIATESTIRAEAYQTEIRRLIDNADIAVQSCPLFVALAEEGIVEGPIAEAIVRHYLADLLMQHKPDTLVLGCTHFPALANTIQKVIGNEIRLIDSAHATASVLAELLQEQQLLSDSVIKGKNLFLVSDSPERFQKAAKNFLVDEIRADQIEWVNGCD